MENFNIGTFLDSYITPTLDKIAEFVFWPINFFGEEVPIIIFWILIAGLFFTFYLRGVAIWGFKHSLGLIFRPKKDTGKAGEVSPFKALMTALSGTIGLGSIAGVALSISMGGPGAAFWVIVGAILGMSLKFAEATLAVKYRRFNPDGSVSGGPMFYISHGLTRKKLRWLAKPMAIIFAVLCIGGAITGGNMLQMNQVAAQISKVVGPESVIYANIPWICGLIMAVLVGAVVIGGIKSISNAATKLVPLKIFVYLFAALAIILLNFKSIPEVTVLIIKQAFNPDAIYGGMFAALIMGLRRSVQTNEAGTGSASIAYATSKTNEPASQGFIALLEPFLTGVMCTITAFAIIMTGAHLVNRGETTGIEMTSLALSSAISFFPIILAAIVCLYALSCAISWAYYGQKAWNFLLGEGKKRNISFQAIYCACIVVGAVLNVTSVINIADAMMLAMAVPNIIAMYILAPEIKKEMVAYCKRHGIGKKFC
jgi:AGCS family alanine or glycine:cation symporter